MPSRLRQLYDRTVRFQILDRQGEVRSQLLVDRRRPDLDAFGLYVQLASQTEQLNERTASGGNRICRTDCLLGLDVKINLSKSVRCSTRVASTL